jgi:hypothetical protein
VLPPGRHIRCATCAHTASHVVTHGTTHYGLRLLQRSYGAHLQLADDTSVEGGWWHPFTSHNRCSTPISSASVCATLIGQIAGNTFCDSVLTHLDLPSCATYAREWVDPPPSRAHAHKKASRTVTQSLLQGFMSQGCLLGQHGSTDNRNNVIRSQCIHNRASCMCTVKPAHLDLADETRMGSDGQ